MTIPFITQEISGLAEPTYASGGANRKYVDAISSNLAAGMSDTPSNWTTLTGGASFETFEGAIGVSGSTSVSLDVAGYSTISSNAQWAENWLNTSGSLLSDYLGSGEEYTTAYDHSQDNTQAHSDYLLNNADDDTSGTLTAKSFIGPISSTAISGASLRLGSATVVIDSVLDEDNLASDSATGLATQQSIKAYVDAVGDTPSTWSDMTTGTGLTPITVGVSGSAGTTVNVLGYSTISGNASRMAASGVKYTQAYSWFNASANALSQIHGSGEEYTAAYDWYVASAQSLSAYQSSGEEYSAAYASAQALKIHAFHAKVSSSYLAVGSGWANVSSQGTIAHGLGAKPNSHYVVPSGSVAFAIATTVDTSNITVYMTAPGKRDVGWRAEL